MSLARFTWLEVRCGANTGGGALQVLPLAHLNRTPLCLSQHLLFSIQGFFPSVMPWWLPTRLQTS